RIRAVWERNDRLRPIAHIKAALTGPGIGHNYKVSEMPASIPDSINHRSLHSDRWRLPAATLQNSELQAHTRRQGMVAGTGCVLAGIVQAEIEIIAQGMIKAQVQTQPAALELAPLHRKGYASGTDSAPRQPLAAQILTQRQTGPANPPALLPVPGRCQAPAKGQVAALLVRSGQTKAGALQRSTIQAHQSQAGKG